MKAIVQYKKGPRSIRLDEVPVPEPASGEVWIRVEAAGLCGTDRHI
ncbi:MAG TPA: hypothetical protein VMX75_06400 [Spirochaetia bacterium]|nr:hypothetical protein [Spirochaetia bacterium]